MFPTLKAIVQRGGGDASDNGAGGSSDARGSLPFFMDGPPTRKRLMSMETLRFGMWWLWSCRPAAVAMGSRAFLRRLPDEDAVASSRR